MLSIEDMTLVKHGTQLFSTITSVIFYEDRMMDINDRIPTTELVNAIKILNRCYTLYKPWPGHDSHFHTTFISWLDCPQTCVEEVQEFFSKI